MKNFADIMDLADQCPTMAHSMPNAHSPISLSTVKKSSLILLNFPSPFISPLSSRIPHYSSHIHHSSFPIPHKSFLVAFNYPLSLLPAPPSILHSHPSSMLALIPHPSPLTTFLSLHILNLSSLAPHRSQIPVGAGTF